VPTQNISQSSTCAVADLVIDALVTTEHELLEHIASLETNAAVFRDVAIATLDALRDLTVRHERLLRAHEQLADDYRRVREDTLFAAGAGA